MNELKLLRFGRNAQVLVTLVNYTMVITKCIQYMYTRIAAA